MTDHALITRIEGQLGRMRIALDLRVAGTLLLVGPNGAGKTSTLRMLLGVLPVQHGFIAIGERVLFDGEAGIDLPTEQRRLGYVPQNYALFPHLSARQNIQFALDCATEHAKLDAHQAGHARVAALVKELKLEPVADRRVNTLSAGERQRVALARALAAQPQALLLDEPLSALDAYLRDEVREFLASYLRDLRIPTIVVTHDAEDAIALGQDIAVLEAGTQVQRGYWTELQKQPATTFVARFTRSSVVGQPQPRTPARETR